MQTEMIAPMSRLEQKISSGETVVTTELTPPKGTNLTELLAKAETLRTHVDAINLTESARARLAIDPRAVARLLLAMMQSDARGVSRIRWRTRKVPSIWPSSTVASMPFRQT